LQVFETPLPVTVTSTVLVPAKIIATFCVPVGMPATVPEACTVTVPDVGQIGVPTTTTDFGPFLTQVLAKKPDYAVFIVNGMMFVNCMKQAYAMGMKEKMKFVSTHANIEEINACGPDVVKDVTFVTDYFWNLPNDRNKIFVEKFMKKCWPSSIMKKRFEIILV
jgi:hypothetical protein